MILDLSTALGLDCWGCFTNTSWADCEDKLISRPCHDDAFVMVCQTKVFVSTAHGKTVTHYSKECGMLSDCNEKLCNMEHQGRTLQCQLECCCHDNCNTGVLVLRENEGGVHSLHGVCIMLTVMMALYLTMTE